MKTKDFDYSLPEELIAQHPAERGKSRLLVLYKDTGKIEHTIFERITDFLNEKHVLVLNETKVIKARFFGKRKTGGKVEIFLLHKLNNKRWRALARPSKKLKEGERIKIADGFEIEIKGEEEGKKIVEFLTELDEKEAIERYGKVPLPPYIRREAEKDDEERYQTVYAKEEGSVAAPTAGLHFTQEILKKLEEKGVKILKITLHIGLGTFKPIKTENVENHKMEEEFYKIKKEVWDEITKSRDKKIIAVGTSTVRALESCIRTGKLESWTDLFIYPGFEFRIIDGMVTNFHLPCSTPLLLVCALAGKGKIMRAYKEAIKRKYRFYSYGDAMLIL